MSFWAATKWFVIIIRNVFVLSWLTSFRTPMSFSMNGWSFWQVWEKRILRMQFLLSATMTSRFMLSAAPTSATWCPLSKSSESENRFDLNRITVLKATFWMLPTLWFPTTPSVWARTCGRMQARAKKSELTVRITTLMKPALFALRFKNTSTRASLPKILRFFIALTLSHVCLKLNWPDAAYRSWFTAVSDSSIVLKLRTPWPTCAWQRTLQTILHSWESWTFRPAESARSPLKILWILRRQTEFHCLNPCSTSAEQQPINLLLSRRLSIPCALPRMRCRFLPSLTSRLRRADWRTCTKWIRTAASVLKTYRN